MHNFVLSAGGSRAIATLDGGGLLEFSRDEGAGRRHILRPASLSPSGPLDRALIVMAPWCNRIGGGGFWSGEIFHSISPNLPGFPMPLHGTACQSRWDFVRHQQHRLQLELDATGPAPFRYRAKLTYTLSPDELSVELCVTNTGSEKLPFGIGLHPWFACDKETKLQFFATSQVISNAAGLPVHIGPLADSFSVATSLPEGRIDNTFIGWDGTALLNHSDGAVKLRSDAPMLHVFSPNASAGFCCLEPSTSLANAANFLGSQAPSLQPGATTSVTAVCSWEPPI